MFSKLLFVLVIISIVSAEHSFHVSPIKTNWIAAVESCHRMGMRLAVLDTDAKHEAAVQLGKSIKPQNSQFFGFWLGASDLAYGGGSFMWHDTGSWVQFSRWNTGEPSGGNEHCVTLYYWPAQKFHWTWNDAPCDTTLYALCEPRGAQC
ncbi:C-type lectin domain family 6 member A-like [Armigeres subalbatus]|uniref:C-type lectin domain family 6 member A-like n=1 Tax=Armigeres subalbatus TaxID=124917 RepID=UPI002ED35DBD